MNEDTKIDYRFAIA